MGYTHYWSKKPSLSKNKWELFTEDVVRLLYDGTNLVCADDAKVNDYPEVNEDYVRFNGRGEDAHETFYFERIQTPNTWQQADEKGRYFNFCKTARKHYDIYVVAVLQLAKLHFGNAIELSSDGDDEELKAGIELAKEYYSLEGN